MCTFVNLGSAQPSAQECIVFVLGKARLFLYRIYGCGCVLGSALC